MSNTKIITFDFFVPSPRVRVCQAWCASMVKFVGRNAIVDGNVGGGGGGGAAAALLEWW